MKAVICEKYGPPEVLRLQEIPEPIPSNEEVLIKIHATTITTADCQMRKGTPYWGRLITGITRPRKNFRIPGLEFAGTIERTGKDVSLFKVGQRVFGFTGMHLSAHTEYVCLPQYGSLYPIPDNVTYADSAASVDGATTALFFIRKLGDIQKGQSILVIGASGSIGSFSVQLAKAYGATVTGVCSTANTAMVECLGADHVIDYTHQDFTRTDIKFDMIFDTVGKCTFAKARNNLKDDGTYLSTVGLRNHFLKYWTSLSGTQHVKTGISMHKQELFPEIKGLLEKGTIRPVIDRYYGLDHMVEAHRYVDTGHKKGNVVIEVTPRSRSTE